MAKRTSRVTPDGRQVNRAVAIVEQVLGKRLPAGAIVHHADGDESNDANSNLVVCKDQAYHMLLHKRSKAYDVTGFADSLYCRICKEWDHPANIRTYFYKGGKGNSYTVHPSCNAENVKQYRSVKENRNA